MNCQNKIDYVYFNVAERRICIALPANPNRWQNLKIRFIKDYNRKAVSGSTASREIITLCCYVYKKPLFYETEINLDIEPIAEAIQCPASSSDEPQSSAASSGKIVGSSEDQAEDDKYLSNVQTRACSEKKH